MTQWKLAMASAGGPHEMPYSQRGALVISPDARYLAVVMERLLRIYFLQTRQCVKTIDLDCRHVCDAIMDSQHVYVFNDRGKVIVVDWKDRVRQIVRRFELKPTLDILSIVAAVPDEPDTYYAICGEDKKRTMVKLAPDTDAEEVWSEDNVTLHAVLTDRTKVAFLRSNHEVAIYHADTPQATPERLKFPYKLALTLMAISNEQVVALGSELGPIQVIYGGLETPVPQKLLKWHVEAVSAVAFTPDGRYLLSGGKEKVLVFWHLDSDKTQFLPRLNGPINAIGIDDPNNAVYQLLLDHGPHHAEVLVVLAVDLVLRLAVLLIRPQFHSDPRNISKAKKKLAKRGDVRPTKLLHDYSTQAEINPKLGHVFVPTGLSFQTFDLVRQEQLAVQNATLVISTGKVRLEQDLVEPEITGLKFTVDGEWMCTFDQVETLEVDQLLLKHDKQYALKFWKFVDTSLTKDPSLGHWELTTKIMAPHGTNPVVAIVAAPKAYQNGQAFLTADNKGGLRVWRPRSPVDVTLNALRGQQTAWTMRKTHPLGAVALAVSCAWLDDGLVIVRLVELTVTTFNAHTFQEVPASEFCVPLLTGLPIRAVQFVGVHLVVLLKTRVLLFNMVTGAVDEYVAAVDTTTGASLMMAVDPERNVVALAVNFYHQASYPQAPFEVRLKVVVIDPTQPQPVSHHPLNSGVAAVRYDPTTKAFVLVDFDLRLATLAVEANDDGKTLTVAEAMKQKLLDAQITADIMSQRRAADARTTATGIEAIDVGGEAAAPKPVDLNLIQPLFHLAVELETLFDRIVKVIR